MPDNVFLQSEDFQERILCAYTFLRLLREDWGGALLLCGSLEPQGAALAMGANFAGAVCLSVEDRPELLKDALRLGACDFIVNALDEALRIMKNEIRKHQPVSVGLKGDPTGVLLECIERGVQPELVVGFEEIHSDDPVAYQEALRQLQRRGAIFANFGKDALDMFEKVKSFARNRSWELRSFVLDDAAKLRVFDARVLALLGEEEGLRRQWIRSASRIVQRQSPLRRALWVTAEERKMLDDSLR